MPFYHVCICFSDRKAERCHHKTNQAFEGLCMVGKEVSSVQERGVEICLKGVGLRLTPWKFVEPRKHPRWVWAWGPQEQLCGGAVSGTFWAVFLLFCKHSVKFGSNIFVGL